jgi:hypothetical protein
METSKPAPRCQRPRNWCEPGQAGGLKILPEPQSERNASKCAGFATRYPGREDRTTINLWVQHSAKNDPEADL